MFLGVPAYSMGLCSISVCLYLESSAYWAGMLRLCPQLGQYIILHLPLAKEDFWFLSLATGDDLKDTLW